MFEVYGRDNCSWCEAAKALLERKGERYVYYNIYDDLGRFRELFPNSKTVPQIVDTMCDYDGTELYKHIGGYSELEKYLS